MTASARPLLRYRVLVRLLSPALLGWALRVAFDIARGKAGPGVPAGVSSARDFLRQRLGYAPRTTCRDSGASPTRWLHAASVGEVLTVLPLIEAILADSATRVLVTTATPTGAAVLAARLGDRVRHRYLPLDLPAAVARFLDQERPVSGWIVETELWPWLFSASRARDIPLTLLSARLSARSLSGVARLLAPVYGHALGGVHVLARSDADAERYRRLAPDARSVACVGDLKRVPGVLPLMQSRPIDGRYCLAASTHEDEESMLARAWLGLPDAGLLVIVPRHPARGDAIAESLAQAMRVLKDADAGVARRSAAQTPGPADRLYLADTLGELDRFYAHADAVFVGGSLVPRGGHNLLEAARHGVPIATGAHTANFMEMVADLRAADALTVFEDAGSVAAWLAATAANGEVGAGQRAAQVARGDDAVLPRYLAALADGAHTVA